MINFIIWIVVGAFIGWVASVIMHTDAQQGTLLDIIVGVVGAFVAGLVVNPLIGGGNINQGNFHLVSIVASLVGAIILLAVVNLFRRGVAR